MGKSNKKTSIVSSYVRFGRRTYFFDINLTKEDKKYLRITESKFVDEDKDRIYNSFILFPENVADFQKSMNEIVGHLA